MELVKQPGWTAFENCRESLSDKTILEAFVQYMSDDQLIDFCEQLKKDYDL